MPRPNSLVESVSFNPATMVCEVVLKNGTDIKLNLKEYPENIMEQFLTYGVEGKVRNTLSPLISKDNAESLAVEVLGNKDSEWQDGEWRTVVEGSGQAVLNLWAETYKRLLPTITKGKVAFETDAQWKKFEASLPDAIASKYQKIPAFEAMRVKIAAERKAEAANKLATALDNLDEIDTSYFDDLTG